MINAPLPATLEDFYGAVADAVDAVGPQQEGLLLCKLALLLAHALDNPERAIALVKEAALDLS